jgi:dolichol-phosphate mannosyltransferase
MRTLIVLPTHNEAPNIVQILSQIVEHVPETDIVVIDDASTDGTRQRVSEVASANTHVRLVERHEKLGLGDAYLFAFRVGLEDDYEAFVEIDADLSHDPAVLPTMLDVAAHGISVVIGSRYIPGGTVSGWSRRRLWLSRWANRYVAIALGLAINDATSGYRVYTSEALHKIGLDGVQASGYGFQIEMTYRAVRAGLSVVEIPIAFSDRIAGTSKMDLRIVLEAFRLVTVWGLRDIFSLARRRRAYRTRDGD